jgi:hypothetical protein
MSSQDKMPLLPATDSTSRLSDPVDGMGSPVVRALSPRTGFQRAAGRRLDVSS